MIDRNRDIDLLFEGARCRKLWVSVIEQAILDACYVKGSAREQNARDLRKWVDSDDFKMITSLAGITGARTHLKSLIVGELDKSEQRYRKTFGRNKTVIRRYTEPNKRL